ncbi:hypothetical protein P4637_04400 [Halalkalibacterium halodurans]|jgi:hypothetical protein|uniref:Uncharacterized protein n=1 Tax=Halalkalibacterium halodurans TaxID=86665 RepID=A0A0M0KFX2_ALKHA|nr:hypothetical protein [Halalkalibacterium halodurans]MED3645819.1 hypothetical protein [Halalkalibacterium halodurans]MED4079622.1 hypothetical protein [Halalkalibacterium halodurans]MED4084101.1 hypothetical protein [Halalkalibacterium halodurans]MED4104579.1 hypothetical protein [Halalkalibacterium halodurans]MED4108307.1 hypothetical protein [Halalkalibacterium halodurans]
MKRKMVLMIGAVLVSVCAGWAMISPKSLAITTVKIYTTLNYHDHDLTYVSVEYAKGFGDYSVVLKDREGSHQGFLVTPSFFPVIVSYDPLDNY